MTNSLGRWVYGGQHAPRNYPWPQCRFCRAAQDRDCPPATCQLRGSVLCHGAGAECRVCHYGFIPGWSRQSTQRQCGRKHCAGEAVAKAPRVGQVCAEHATVTTLRLVGGRTLTIAQYVAETDRAPRLRQRLGVLQVGAMTRYTITMPLYLDRVRRGDPIVVGYGGDHPDTVLDKLLASHTTIPPHLGSKELDQVERGWPKSRINEPTEWIVGTVARVRTGRRSR